MQFILQLLFSLYTADMCCRTVTSIKVPLKSTFPSDSKIRSSSDRIRDEIFLKAHPTATRKLPDAIIIGVKKGGTRALLEFLRIHPDVRATGPEVHFFDKDYFYSKGLDWYRQQMPPTLPGQLTMEKTPSYFITKDVPKRIHKMNKNIKLILVVRDPVTRAMSDYAQATTRHYRVKEFEDVAFLNKNTGIVNTSWGAIKVGLYSRHLHNWLKYFPLKQIHIISGEELISDPANVLSNVQNFLNLKKVIREEHFFFNRTKGFPCLRKKKNKRKSPHCLGSTKGRKHPDVSIRAVERLRTYYKPFNLKFYRMTGRDFGWL